MQRVELTVVLVAVAAPDAARLHEGARGAGARGLLLVRSDRGDAGGVAWRASALHIVSNRLVHCTSQS